MARTTHSYFVHSPIEQHPDGSAKMAATTTLNEIYAAINPLPASLSEKGKAKPEVSLSIEANSNIYIQMSWTKSAGKYEYDRDYKSFMGATPEEAIGKAVEFIASLPDAKTAKLHDFMGQLGKVIDHGRALGIEVDYLNPLTETMKRLSENVITYQPA